jgi:hypothetical protein
MKYLNSESNIILDHKCEIFQTLSGCQEDIIVEGERVYNKYTDSHPIFIHGNGLSKIFLNNIENKLTMQMRKDPKTFFAVYCDSSDPKKFNSFLNSTFKISCNNKYIVIYDRSHDPDSQFSNYHSNVKGYVYDDFINSDCEYYFLIEQDCIVTNTNVYVDLLQCMDDYRSIVAPLLTKTDTVFSNFWGAIKNDGWYLRSDNYIDIVERAIIGVWNVPYIRSCILFKRYIITGWNLNKKNNFADADMQLCCNLRNYSLFMHLCNHNIYGRVF